MHPTEDDLKWVATSTSTERRSSTNMTLTEDILFRMTISSENQPQMKDNIKVRTMSGSYQESKQNPPPVRVILIPNF